MTIDLRTVLRQLSSIDSPPSLRSVPKPGDLNGKFDQWFDGGALKVVTGWSEYHFSDGTLAIVPTTATLLIEMRLPSGAYIIVSEQSKAPPNMALLNQ